MISEKMLFRLVIFAAACVLAAGIGATIAEAQVDAQTQETLLQLGSRGDQVKQVQQKLKQWGYFSGAVDGIYGAATRNAVLYFQRKNGLIVDGKVGPQTLDAMGISDAASTAATNSNYYLLAKIISAESRGEPYSGQVAVGAVIMNRVKHPSFPKTLSGVIYQPGAFTAIVDGQFHEAIVESAYRAARDALNGIDTSGGAIYYYNPKTATNQWIRSRPIVKTIGSHIFCK